MAVLQGALIFVLCSLVATEELYANCQRYPEYDYIVVGAGSSGAVIANRLSEDPRHTVLLLEAGGLPPEKSEVPLLTYELGGMDLDWRFRTEPQKKASLAYPEQSTSMPRGKVLGGSSILNCMLYVRGNKEDFNDWARDGAEGWSYDDVAYYFLKSEDQTNRSLLLDGYHKTGGPLTVSHNVFSTKIRGEIIEAAASSGYNIVDYNGAHQNGIGLAQSNIKDGRRDSTEKAFLRPAAKRPNLDILYHAFVTKIEFEDRTATNVSFDFQNAPRSIRARKEIILSAGAIGSPQILMLSGIGPKEHLESMKIPVLADLPVGQNLQDHIREAGLLYYFDQAVSLVFSRDVKEQSYEEFQRGEGPLTMPCGVELLGFIKTKLQNGWDQRPDIELPFLAPVVYPESDDQTDDGPKRDVMAVYPTLIRPDSKGFIKLNSSNPYDHPIIDPQYLTEEMDVLRIAEGLKMTLELMNSPAIQKYNPELKRKAAPGCGTPDMANLEYVKCAIRAWTRTADHQCCTCKMGGSDDARSVVDPQLRVIGVKSLRVADASIMPSVTSGNTHAPCVMIGEKAADLILGRKWDPSVGHLVDI